MELDYGKFDGMNKWGLVERRFSVAQAEISVNIETNLRTLL